MSKKPVLEVRTTRNAKIAVWNNGEKGYAITIGKPSYKNNEGVWTESGYWESDLPALKEGIQRVMDWLWEKRNALRPEAEQEEIDFGL